MKCYRGRGVPENAATAAATTNAWLTPDGCAGIQAAAAQTYVVAPFTRRRCRPGELDCAGHHVPFCGNIVVPSPSSGRTVCTSGQRALRRSGFNNLEEPAVMRTKSPSASRSRSRLRSRFARAPAQPYPIMDKHRGQGDREVPERHVRAALAGVAASGRDSRSRRRNSGRSRRSRTTRRWRRHSRQDRGTDRHRDVPVRDDSLTGSRRLGGLARGRHPITLTLNRIRSIDVIYPDTNQA